MPTLTAHIVNTAQPPADGKSQLFIRDSSLAGFALRVTPSGAKAFIVEAKVSGRTRRVTIGKTEVFSLAEARKEAKKLLAMMATGVDPTECKREAKAKSLTLQQAFDIYIEAKRLKPRTVENYEALIKNHLSDWRDRPLLDNLPSRVILGLSGNGRYPAVSSLWPWAAGSPRRSLCC